MTARDHGVPIRVLRQYGVDSLSPAQAAAQFLACAHLDAANYLQICCESERGYDPDWQLQVINAIKQGGYVGRFLIGNYATGNPPKITGDPPHFPELEPLYGLLRRPDTDLSLDAYSGLLVMDPRWAAWAPYTVFRPTLIRADLARQGIPVDVVVTESGGDNIAPVTTGGGWQSRNWSSDEYLKTLLAVDADDQQHPWLLARCLFTSGPTPDWWAFDIAPIAAQLAAYVATQAATTPQRAQDAPSSPIAAPTAPAPAVTPHAPVATPAGPAAPPIAKRGHHPMADVPELDQGWTSACWAYATAECFDASGYYVSPFDIYAQVKGKVFAAPGDPATFDELRHGINAASAMTGARIKWFGPLGIANDPATVDQLVKDGWYVVAGLAEQVLQGASQTYGHYVVLRKIDYDKDGTPEMSIVDSYRAEDGGTDRYPLAQLHAAMAANWDSGVDALAFQILS